MDYKMELTQEEADILEGKQGETLQKIMKTLVTYGDVFGAKKLVPITAPSHIASSVGSSSLQPLFDITDELIKESIKTKQPFTTNPRPIDYDNVKIKLGQKFKFKSMYGDQKDYEERLKKIGLRSDNDFTCTCYLEQVDNIPKKGDILSWSDPNAVIYANSVLGAKTNRNPAIIDLFGSIIGKVPEFGLLTDQGRKANRNVVINTKNLPNPQILGNLIGIKMGNEIPYIQGIDTFLGRQIDQEMQDYLKDMGAACAASGTMGLYHVDNVTPDAVEHGKDILEEDAKTYLIDDEELTELELSYPVYWKRKKMKPKMCLIGCPHMSYDQIVKWAEKIERALKMHEKTKVTVPTVICCAPEMIHRFRANFNAYNRLKDCGVTLTSICPLKYMDNPKCSKKPVVTNSNTLRTHSTARYYKDEELASIIATGRCK